MSPSRLPGLPSHHKAAAPLLFSVQSTILIVSHCHNLSPCILLQLSPILCSQKGSVLARPGAPVLGGVEDRVIESPKDYI